MCVKPERIVSEAKEADRAGDDFKCDRVIIDRQGAGVAQAISAMEEFFPRRERLGTDTKG